MKADMGEETAAEETKELTPEQIVNWRKLLYDLFGSFALMMSDDEIRKFRDKQQTAIDTHRAKEEV